MKNSNAFGGRTLTFNERQWSLLAGFFSNAAILLVGLSLTDQPIVSLTMTMWLRWRIMGAGVAMLALGVLIEWSPRRK